MYAFQCTELLFQPGFLAFESLRDKLWQGAHVHDLLSAADQPGIRVEERDTGVSLIRKVCFSDSVLRSVHETFRVSGKVLLKASVIL